MLHGFVCAYGGFLGRRREDAAVQCWWWTNEEEMEYMHACIHLLRARPVVEAGWCSARLPACLPACLMSPRNCVLLQSSPSPSSKPTSCTVAAGLGSTELSCRLLAGRRGGGVGFRQKGWLFSPNEAGFFRLAEPHWRRQLGLGDV